MTSNARPDTRLRSLRRLLALLLVLALAACGPGSGGTGTGPIGNIVFTGASGPSGGTGNGSGGMGNIPSVVQLRLHEGVVTLSVDCGRTVFTGGWSGAADAPAVTLVGRVDSAGLSTPATLSLQFPGAAADSAVATVTLLDADGAVLLGPLPLQRVSDAGGGCG